MKLKTCLQNGDHQVSFCCYHASLAILAPDCPHSEMKLLQVVYLTLSRVLQLRTIPNQWSCLGLSTGLGLNLSQTKNRNQELQLLSSGFQFLVLWVSADRPLIFVFWHAVIHINKTNFTQPQAERAVKQSFDQLWIRLTREYVLWGKTCVDLEQKLLIYLFV